MQITNVHIVFFSPCGGTHAVSNALCRDLGTTVAHHSWTLPEDRALPLNFGPCDLAFLAFPVYGGRMPRNIKALFANLAGANTPAALIAVYGNREFEGAFLDLHAAAVASGFLPVAAIAAVAEHSMTAQVATQRPDSTDCEKLAEFGRRILERARRGQYLANAPGAYPDWNLPPGVSLFPDVNRDACLSCGECAKICPVEAIPHQEPAKTDSGKCIVCAACVKYCPVGARSMGSESSRAFLADHIATCLARRKEPEMF